MGNRVLVTGSTGFVGLELCVALLEAGYDVLGVGRSVRRPGFPESVRYLQMDLEKEDLSQAFAGGIDCVVHLAAQAHGKGGTEKQQIGDFRRANVDISLRLATLAIQAGARRFVFVSSIGVHGTGTTGAAISECTPFNPVSPYALSKLEAEQELARLFESACSSELTIVRPPLVYGVNAPGNFGSLLKLANSPLPLPFGMCGNRRNMISRAALVDFLVACIHHPDAGSQSFVVSDTSAVSTKEIVVSLRRGMERAVRLVPVPPAIMAGALGVLGKRDMFSQLFGDLEVCNDKARKLVGWVPCENTLLELERIGKRYIGSCS